MDVILADYELASNCSSVSSERARTYYGRRVSKHSYDSPRLENVRASTIAERKKPLLITRARTACINGLSQIESNAISRDEAFVESRYEARRKFFQDLERRKSLEANSVTLSKAKVMSANKNESIFERNSTVNPSEKPRAHLVKLFDVSLTNASTKEHVESLNDETRSTGNNVAVHSVVWANIAQPCFVKRVNVEEARLMITRNIVSCVNGHNQTEEKIGHRERAECSTIETVVSVKVEPSITHGDNSTVGTNNEQQQHTTMTTTTNTEVTLARSCAEAFQRDNSDNGKDSRPPSDLSSNNLVCDGHIIDRYECGEHTETSAAVDKEINGERLNSTVELKKRNVQSWIENSMCESGWPNSAEVDDNSYDEYCNDIAKIVESIDLNIASSRTELDALPDTDTCVKYNLDSTNMSLIYSLTPPAAVDQDESGNDDTSRDLAEHSSEWHSDSTRSDNDDPLSDYIWIEPTTKADCAKSTRDRRSSSDSSYAELEQPVSERHSASGSDILELPSCTIRELKDIDGEVFLNGINESANEIIADLNASDEMSPLSCEAVEIARQIIAEIIESIYILLHLDSSIYDLGIVREMVRNLINGYRRECSLMESAGRACTSNVFPASNDVDNTCRIKGFLGNASSDFDDCDNQNCEMETHETEVGESPAVIEFCTVAKKLPIITIDNGALELNFRVVEVSTNEYASMSPGSRLRLFGENSIGDDHVIEIDKFKGGERAAVVKSEMETWPCERCSYCREEEESIREKLSCLTPISEELDDALHEVVEPVAPASKSPVDEPLRHLETCDTIDENTAANFSKKHVSLDDTYTISEVSSVVVSDNDEMNEPGEERCDGVWDSSIDCMSYSYETKEFMRLEKALADSSRLSV